MLGIVTRPLGPDQSGEIRASDQTLYRFQAIHWNPSRPACPGDAVEFAPQDGGIADAISYHITVPETRRPTVWSLWFWPEGRASRKQFLLFWFLPLLLCFVGMITLMILHNTHVQHFGTVNPIYPILIVLLFLPILFFMLASAGVVLKRLHDRGLSGRWVLVLPGAYGVGGITMLSHALETGFQVYQISLLLGLILIFIFCCLPGQKRPNRYGPPLPSARPTSAETTSP